MATGKFRIKTDNDWNTIYYRFKQGGQFDAEISTGLQVPKGRWSAAKQKILATKELNNTKANIKLTDLDAFIRKEYEDSRLNGTIVNSKWLKEKISLFFSRETNNPELDERVFFTNYIDRFIEEARSKRSRSNTPIKKRTIQHYQTTKNKLLAFEAFRGRRVRLEDIDLNFHARFIDFLESEQKLNPNTIGGYIDDIKLFCSNAEKRDYVLPKDYKLTEFYSPSNKTQDIYLKEEEINAIYNVDLEHDYLKNARDWLIIGLRTGFRISDFLQLTPENLVDGFIQKETEKTGFPVIIPIHEQVRNILDKRDGAFPRKISDQKFNDYIKIVAEKAGLTEKVDGAKITPVKIIRDGKERKIHRKKFGKYPKHELVTSHICRRSFATNLYGKIDTLTIMKITGHQTEKQFLDYIKITPKEYALKLKELWSRQSLETTTRRDLGGEINSVTGERSKNKKSRV